MANCGVVNSQEKKDCYQQTSNDYSTARKYLFGRLHLIKTSQGMEVEDVYCKKVIGIGVGPMTIATLMTQTVMAAEK